MHAESDAKGIECAAGAEALSVADAWLVLVIRGDHCLRTRWSPRLTPNAGNAIIIAAAVVEGNSGAVRGQAVGARARHWRGAGIVINKDDEVRARGALACVR